MPEFNDVEDAATAVAAIIDIVLLIAFGRCWIRGVLPNLLGGGTILEFESPRLTEVLLRLVSTLDGMDDARSCLANESGSSGAGRATMEKMDEIRLLSYLVS